MTHQNHTNPTAPLGRIVFAALVAAAAACMAVGCGDVPEASSNLSVTFTVTDVGSSSCPTEVDVHLNGRKAEKAGDPPDQPVSIKGTTVSCTLTFTEANGLAPGNWNVKYDVSSSAYELAPGWLSTIVIGGGKNDVTISVRRRFRADGSVSSPDAGMPDKGKQDGFVAPDKGAQADSGVKPDSGTKPDTMAPDKGNQKPDTGIIPDTGKPDTFVPALDHGAVSQGLAITVLNKSANIGCKGITLGVLRIRLASCVGKSCDHFHIVTDGVELVIPLPPGAYWLEVSFGACMVHTAYTNQYPVITTGQLTYVSFNVN